MSFNKSALVFFSRDLAVFLSSDDEFPSLSLEISSIFRIIFMNDTFDTRDALKVACERPWQFVVSQPLR